MSQWRVGMSAQLSAAGGAPVEADDREAVASAEHARREHHVRQVAWMRVTVSQARSV
jgi:hypothetical protein